jgi:ABC-type Fe3+/spermidine/putrescine transport system ATPase subunit
MVGSRHVDVGGVTLSAEQGEARPGVVRVTIRPERVRIEPPATPGENRVQATIERFVYLGSTTQVFVALPGGDRVQALVANSGTSTNTTSGASVTAHLPADALRILADDEPVTA